MAGLKLQINLDGVEKLSAMKAFLEPAAFDRALKGGTRYATKATPPAISKAVGARYTMKAGEIKKDIKGPNFSEGGKSATLILSRRPRTAAAFNGKQTSQGYRFAVYRGQNVTVKNGFLAKGKQGIMLPFYREGKGRYPINVIHGPSLGSVFVGNSKYGDVMKKEVGDRMQKQLVVGIERELKRSARGF